MIRGITSRYPPPSDEFWDLEGGGYLDDFRFVKKTLRKISTNLEVRKKEGGYIWKGGVSGGNTPDSFFHC